MHYMCHYYYYYYSTLRLRIFPLDNEKVVNESTKNEQNIHETLIDIMKFIDVERMIGTRFYLSALFSPRKY